MSFSGKLYFLIIISFNSFIIDFIELNEGFIPEVVHHHRIRLARIRQDLPLEAAPDRSTTVTMDTSNTGGSGNDLNRPIRPPHTTRAMTYL